MVYRGGVQGSHKAMVKIYVSVCEFYTSNKLKLRVCLSRKVNEKSCNVSTPPHNVVEVDIHQ